MKMAIDGRGAILYRGTGIGTYTWQLLAALAKNENVRIYLPGEEMRYVSFRDYDILEGNGKGTPLWEGLFLERALTREKVDLYHVPQNGLGLPLRKQCKETVTIHDMIPYVFPETVGRGYLKEFLAKMPNVIEKSDGIITVSETSKKDIINLFHYPAQQITVIYEAAEAQYQPMARKKAQDFLSANYGIKEDYFLYLGGYGVRKNVKALVLAYYLLQREEKINWKLVLPGKHSGEFDRLDTLVEALGLKEEVLFPGFIPVKDLPYFYGGAAVMVYPSIYEGFGLPPLEAMSMGIPVIASNRSSLPEILGDAPLYFDAFDTVELAEKMHFLYSNERERQVMAKKSLLKAAEYSWEKTVRETWQFWEKIVAEK